MPRSLKKGPFIDPKLEKKVKEMGLKKRGNYFGDTNGMIESFLECDRMKIEFQYWVEDRLKEEVERMVEEECV